MEMSDELKAELVRLGWDPRLVLYGERVSGSPGHLTLRLPSGELETFHAPLIAINGGGQAAIVRFS
jgi:hypothetical protein